MKKTPLRSRSAPLRSREPARGGRKPIKRKRRTPSEFKRIYGSKERVEFVRGLKCAACRLRTTPSVNAHICGGGTARKASYTAVIPLCATCHGLQHDAGWSSLPALDTRERREAAAAQCEAKWQFHLRQTGRARQDTDNG